MSETQLPTLTEDHHGPLAVAPKLSLYQLEVELCELIEFRESCETEEERKAADAQIAVYVEREVRKVDNLRSYLRHCEMMIGTAREEVQIQSGRMQAWTARKDRLKSSVLGVMQMIGEKKLEGRTGTLSIKGNGGQQALTITDESLVPDEFCEAHVVLKIDAWFKRLRFHLGSDVAVCSRVVRNDLVRRALSEPCPNCEGGDLVNMVEEIPVIHGVPDLSQAIKTVVPCSACGGEGTRRVPGARLEPRGSHLEVK